MAAKNQKGQAIVSEEEGAFEGSTDREYTPLGPIDASIADILVIPVKP